MLRRHLKTRLNRKKVHFLITPLMYSTAISFRIRYSKITGNAFLGVVVPDPIGSEIIADSNRKLLLIQPFLRIRIPPLKFDMDPNSIVQRSNLSYTLADTSLMLVLASYFGPS
jgi:hypothetical protein